MTGYGGNQSSGAYQPGWGGYGGGGGGGPPPVPGGGNLQAAADAGVMRDRSNDQCFM